MKSVSKNSSPLFVLALGILISLSVSGQMVKNFTLRDVFKPESQFLKDNPGQSFFNVKPEAFPPAYKSTQGSFPQEIHHFYWDVTTIWMADYNEFRTYDNHANVLTEISVDANTGDTTTGTVNTYDVEGRLAESLAQIWNNGAWENSSKAHFEYDGQGNMTVYLNFTWQAGNWLANFGYKYEYTYDVNNNITVEIYQSWNTTTSSWVNSGKTLNTYDANGNLTESAYQQWDPNTSTWISTSKETYTYSSGVMVEMLEQNWVNNAWEDFEKYTNILWHNWTGDLEESEVASYTVLHYNNGIWENYYRVDITYDVYGGSVETEQNYFNGNWINATRDTYTYDQHGNFTGWWFEMWNNNAWTIDMGNKAMLTYSGDDVIQSIHQFYDHMNLEWVNQFKEEYSNFVYIQGIDLNSSLLAGIQLYPNPTTGILNLEISNTMMEMPSVVIVNMSGQVIYSRHMSESDFPVYKIDLSDCSRGIYFVKIQNTSEVKVGKVIIQ